MRDAWLRLIEWDGSDEFLNLCSEALREVQDTHAHKLAEQIRVAATGRPPHGLCPEISTARNAADLIDPEARP